MIGCLQNLFLLFISLRTHENFKKIFILEKKHNFFFMKTDLLQFDWHFVPNLNLNIKYKITLFKIH